MYNLTIMFDPEISLDYNQRRETEQRILITAELIRGGAIIGDLGNLIISDRQLERAHIFGDPLAGERIESFTEQEILNESIESAWSRYYPEGPNATLTKNTWRRLNKYGIETIRDVLVAGKRQVSGIRNVGVASYIQLSNLLTASVPKQTWQNRPSVSEIADFCEDLDQVNILAVTKHAFRTRRLTVAQVADTPRSSLPDLMKNYQSMLSPSEAEQVHAAAVQFAAEFKALHPSDN